jgi:hypothetical protein
VSVFIYLAVDGPRPALAAELQARTALAYEQYLARATSDFLSRASDGNDADQPSAGAIVAGPAREDGIIDVPGGLVHHWVGTDFIRGIGLQEVVKLSRAYEEFPRVHKNVIDSRVLEHEGDRYRVLMRIKAGAGGVTGVLDIRSSVRYSRPTQDSVLVVSSADEIREVKDAGERDERLLPPGNDSGYLWRASTFTQYVETREGVWIRMETLGLSRRFPPLLGWLIEPIARRLGRRSVEVTLQEFQAALQARRTS